MLLVTMVLDVLTGPAMLTVRQVVLAIVSPGSVDLTTSVIVWSLRLPITLMAVLVGVALGVSGVCMQTILGNPLASPYTLGYSAAAGFGAAAAIVSGVTPVSYTHLTLPTKA